MNKKKLIVFLLAIIVIILIFIVLKPKKKADETPVVTTKDVVVALTDIPAFTNITAEMLEMKSYPLEYVPAGSYETMDSLINATTRVNIAAGDAVLKNNVAEVGEKSGHLAQNMESGKRAMTVAVDNISGVCNMLKVGDHVDVLVSTSDLNQAMISQLIEMSLLNNNIKDMDQDQETEAESTEAAPVVSVRTDDDEGDEADSDEESEAEETEAPVATEVSPYSGQDEQTAINEFLTGNIDYTQKDLQELIEFYNNYQLSSGRRTSLMLIEDVEILALNQMQADGLAPIGEGGVNTYANVTLAVLPEDTAKLLWGFTDGSIFFALRADGDQEIVPVRPFRAYDAFDLGSSQTTEGEAETDEDGAADEEGSTEG